MAYKWKNGKVVRHEMPLLTREQLKELENLPSDGTLLDELAKKIKFPKPVMKYVDSDK